MYKENSVMDDTDEERATNWIILNYKYIKIFFG